MVGERSVGMQGPALRATGRSDINKMLAGRRFDGEACATTRKMETQFFLKINGMFYFAGRQEPQRATPRKMETPLF